MEKERIEIWNNTEDNKCIYSFELDNEQEQHLSIRKGNRLSQIHIDITTGKVTVITKQSVFETIL